MVGAGPKGSPQGPILNVWASHVHQAWVLRLDFVNLQEGARPQRSLSCPHPQFRRRAHLPLSREGVVAVSFGSQEGPWPQKKRSAVYISVTVCLFYANPSPHEQPSPHEPPPTLRPQDHLLSQLSTLSKPTLLSMTLRALHDPTLTFLLS